MGNVEINKKFKVEVVLDKTIHDHSNDEAAQEKAKKAVAFLKKHGVPKSFSRKSK
jgi:hypothetical protein